MKRALFCGVMILLCLPAIAQQTDINKYTLFTGFDYMISPARNLTERGLEADIGYTAKPWLGLGFDFGALGSDVFSGAGTISGGETIYAPLLTSIDVAPNSIHVPFKSTTYTFAAGPQFYIRKFEKVTFLVRPGLGGIHETADITFPPELALLFAGLQLTPPNSHQVDTEFFFGLGGGVEVNASKHIGVRFTADWVNTHLFSNLLTPRQNYIRFAVGPTWKWGHYR